MCRRMLASWCIVFVRAHTCLWAHRAHAQVCNSAPYSYKSDVWALGCVLFEMCELTHAFNASNLLGLVWKIVQVRRLDLD